MEKKVYEIYFTYKGMPYRWIRGSVKATDDAIKSLVLKGAAIQRIVEW